MKTARKVLLIALCAVLLVSASVMGTLAYLADQESVQNTFTVGKVNIKLEETDITKNDGSKTEDGNAYHLMPGGTYTKDPVVTVLAGSEQSYVRVLVTVSNLDDLKAAFPAYVAEDGTFLLQELVQGWNNNVWEINNVNGSVYEFRYVGTVAKSATNTELPALFTEVVIPEGTTSEQMAELEDGITIDIVAHAIQAEGFDTADEAWATWEN